MTVGDEGDTNHTREKLWTVGAIAQALGFEAEGALELPIDRPSHPATASARDLALAMDSKYLDKLSHGAAKAAMLSPDTDWRALGLEAAVFAPRPRYALAGVSALFDDRPSFAAGVHPSAVIAPDAEVADTAFIGPFCIVDSGAKIGAGTVLMGQAWVGPGAEIGPDGLLHPGVRIGRRVQIGARVIIHPNAIIGGDGFSFVTPEPSSVEDVKQRGAAEVAANVANQRWARICSLGSVRIGDDVEIGGGTAIDRGTVIDTQIGSGTKIDNLVQIGHNVQIGEHCLLCGQVGIAGSAEIGDRVVLGGQSGVADQARVENDVVAMAGSGLAGLTRARSVVGGRPALPRDTLGQMLLQQRRLPRLAADVLALKKALSEREGSG
ncbi:MAG: UDP-3-O-(3-hydroxymyristoyl)glucosamine N-acyltransferase [Rhodobacteraceae bacterium]|nr:UDP-3-O-(3-hydroxymyristoyl)glucosamine N-acyltransferase [Paracoccaceae bacterium]